MTSTATAAAPVYVVILHKPSRRAFTLDRGYNLLTEQMNDTKRPARPSTSLRGWLPVLPSQRPAWIEALPAREFVAYWLPERRRARP